MPGVSNVNVDFESQTATFTKGDGYDETTPLQTLDGEGYTSTVAD